MVSLSGLLDVLAFWRRRKAPLHFGVLFKTFRTILERNNRILEQMGDMGDKLGGEYVFDRQYIVSACETLGDQVFKLISDLSVLARNKNDGLFAVFANIQHEIHEELAGRHAMPEVSLVLDLDKLSSDLFESAGNKLAVLGDVRNVLGMETPDGFVVTAKAFMDFMAQNGLPELIETRLKAWDGEDEAVFSELCHDVREQILGGKIPKPLRNAVNAALDKLARRNGRGELHMALRSSAWGEDSESSFAGQYETVLNVTPDNFFTAYRTVLASAYSEMAWRYRLHRGYREHEMVMPVGCQLMVEAAVSGGLYTLAPVGQEREVMVVNAAWGLGAPVVDGTGEADTFILGRSSPYPVHSAEIAHKAKAMILSSASGTAYEDVPEARRDVQSLTPEQLERLAQAAMTLERFYKRPQDVEWAFTRDGTLNILQSRPLNMRSRLPEFAPCPEEATRDAEVVFQGRGTVVQRGVAVGRVFVVHGHEDLDEFPYGAILVSRYTSPRFAKVMRKAQGIITDVGSPTGHMATIAREYRVPTVVGTGMATKLLKTGEEITLDASTNAVYRGALGELCRYELTEVDVFEDAYEYRLLRRVLRRITPLHLHDPHAASFNPAECRTYHDITRFVHERSVEELIGLSERGENFSDATPRHLVTKLPLGLTVIDIEDGLAPLDPEADATSEDVTSIPLRALLEGLTASDMWSTEPAPVDLKSFMSSFTRTTAAAAATDRSERNLAVVSRSYMNLNLRLGYHFTLIDAFITPEINDNYIYFRFLGGVTDMARRSRRAKCIGDILESTDFRVEVRGDLVVGRVKKLAKKRMVERMMLLGGLIGYTRQLDVHMDCDEDITRHAACFCERIEALLEEHRERREWRTG
ncbi:pyruvate phosphate dikinase PEP/pyruvate-binding protein [Desulfovibrio sp. X2]|uniref:PEP/pyruvate-binding domain-containing protein n=1 Tax=Desulfovibrio sp. X2 TaxID=941449 RepID=UPI000358BB6E|nr:PEP/pyruvate-binding domain-containing protein [Desulfovibrio sp. X2]EPR44267.1 pyruvate phosphate dikinase PEP/pyruvate-binding protein [Desulfovibrio sp. X2]